MRMKEVVTCKTDKIYEQNSNLFIFFSLEKELNPLEIFVSVKDLERKGTILKARKQSIKISEQRELVAVFQN